MTTDVREATEGWNVIDAERAILWREYEFARGAYATTLVFRGDDGLVVLSPGRGLDPRAFDALREFGDVSALVATNAMHHLGQVPWAARFPDAESYCPQGAITTLERKVVGRRFRSSSSLRTPAHVHWEDPPGFKTGETLLSIEWKDQRIWYTGDLLTNIERTPGPPVSWLFSLTGSAPGFRLFRLGVWSFVADRAAVRQWTLGRLEMTPPTIVVPGHGPPVLGGDVAQRMRAQLSKL